MKKGILLLIAMLLLLTGCGKQEEDIVEEAPTVIAGPAESYSVLLPFESNILRYAHTSSNYIEIGQGLYSYSLNYFSSNSVIVKEGDIIDSYNTTDYPSYRPLVLLRESASNPYGLNPSSSTNVPIGNGQTIQGPMIVRDLYEINFVSKEDSSKLVGISFALVVQEKVTDLDGTSYTIAAEELYNYATTAGRKLENYLRSLPEVGDVPILIMIYNSSSSDSSLPGTFIAQGYFNGRSGQFEKVNERWVLFPTTEALSLDSATYSQFEGFSSSIKDFLPENIGIVGKGYYVNNEIKKLLITINVQGKTYTEIYALTEYVVQLAKDFSLETELIIEITSFSDTISVITKEANSDKIVRQNLN